MPKFAANLSMMFTEVPFLERFAVARANGFSAVEFLFPYEFEAAVIAEQLKAHGLQQVLFNLSPGNWQAGERGLAALPGRGADFRAALDQAIHYAKILQTPRLHVMAGIADWRNAEAQQCYRSSLRLAAEKAGAEGIDVLIEPLNSRDMPGYFLADFNHAAEVIAELNLPNLKLQFDIYHRQIIHGDVLTSLKTLLSIIGHIQVASVPKRQEPGSGELNDFEVFRALDALGYTGWVGCEYRPAAGTAEGLGWMAKL